MKVDSRLSVRRLGFAFRHLFLFNLFFQITLPFYIPVVSRKPPAKHSVTCFSKNL